MRDQLVDALLTLNDDSTHPATGERTMASDAECDGGVTAENVELTVYDHDDQLLVSGRVPTGDVSVAVAVDIDDAASSGDEIDRAMTLRRDIAQLIEGQR